MRRAARAAATLVAASLCLAGPALAGGGNYVVVGGTAYEQHQVHAALSASSFDWSVVPGPITVAILPLPAGGIAVPGRIELDPHLLDSGPFSWGVVQHEYAHEVDFLVLSDAMRAKLTVLLGASAWCYGDMAGLRHEQYGCERFASTLAWAYWTSPVNCMRPVGSGDESGSVAPRDFRRTLEGLLGLTPASLGPARRAVTRTGRRIVDSGYRLAALVPE